MSHRAAAAAVIAAALVLDAACGLAYAAAEHLAAWTGLYNALANAVTLGGNYPPTTTWGYVVNTAECFTVIPLFAATLSLFTSGLTAVHVRKSEDALKAHVEDRLRHHFGKGA